VGNVNAVKIMFVGNSASLAGMVTSVINSINQIDIVGICSSAERARELIGVRNPDFIISDVSAYDVLTSTPPVSRETDIIRRIEDALNNACIPMNYKGYKYLSDSIQLVCKHRELISGVTKKLYPIVAEMNNTSAECVERNMRSAISRAYKLNSNLRAPTCQQFIRKIVYQLTQTA